MRKPKSEIAKLRMSQNRPKGPSNKKWYNNGIVETFGLPENIPIGFVFGRLKDNGKPKQTFVFVSTSGQRLEIVGLVDFCLKNNLNKAHMSQVASGKRKQHKGWTCGRQ
jgi:hypothetical protein